MKERKKTTLRLLRNNGGKERQEGYSLYLLYVFLFSDHSKVGHRIYSNKHLGIYSFHVNCHGKCSLEGGIYWRVAFIGERC